MAIGFLALIVGAICMAISSAGIGNVEHPVPKEKTVDYPYPEEI